MTVVESIPATAEQWAVQGWVEALRWANDRNGPWHGSWSDRLRLMADEGDDMGFGRAPTWLREEVLRGLG